MIEAESLRIERNGSVLLQDLSLSFSPSELTVITGPNGSGKTLLLKCLSGLMKADSGKVILDGSPYPSPSAPAGTRVGMVFQNPLHQIIEQTVEDDILFGLENLDLTADERQHRLEASLTWTGLEAHRGQDPATLSGGELRRLAVAGVLAMGADYILLDEPFENLDYPGVQQVLRQIVDLKHMGKSVILVTHSLEKCLAHADRLILLKEGRSIADALPERVLAYLEDHDVRKPPMKIRDMSWLGE